MDQEYTKTKYIIEKNDHGRQITLSENFSKLLMRHQKEGIKFIWNALVKRNSGAILADEMGMGKTLTVLGFINTYIQYKGSTNILILLPKSVISSWEGDILKCPIKTYSFKYYKKYPKRTRPTLKNNCAYLMTYDSFFKFSNIYDVI